MRFPTETPPMAVPGRTVTCASCLIAAIVILGMLGPVRIATAQAPATQEDLEAKVHDESAQLERLKEQLDALESIGAPRPAPAVSAVESPNPKQKPQPAKRADIPSAPLSGAEEEFADTLFVLGEYGRARAIYQQIIDNKPSEKTAAWIHVQIGNCARREGDFATALDAYDMVMTETPESFWAEEAAWWTDQIKWRLLWKQILNPEPLEPASAAR